MARAPSSEKDRVCLALVTGAHGLAGEVRLKSFAAQPLDVAAYGKLQDQEGERSFEITKVRTAKGGVVARLKGVSSRVEADALKGTRLYVERSRLPGAAEGEWYYADLVGLRAIDTQGIFLGEVIAVQNYGAEDLLEIKPDNAASVLVPFRSEIVTGVDLAAGELIVDAPEEFFDD